MRFKFKCSRYSDAFCSWLPTTVLQPAVPLTLSPDYRVLSLLKTNTPRVEEALWAHSLGKELRWD